MLMAYSPHKIYHKSGRQTLTADSLAHVLFTLKPRITGCLSSDLLCRIKLLDSSKLFSIFLSTLLMSVGSIQDAERNLDNYAKRVYAPIDRMNC